MKRNVVSEKVMVLGVDGMDPRFAKKMLAEGRMPNLQKMINMGSCREDLMMLGGVPTITPPMWTSLATGANPNVHGITCFWNPSEDRLDEVVYAMDSRLCRAEQLWNVTAESGMKTLVWHWPGSSWPPTSTSENLHVVDGTQPAYIGANAIADSEVTVYASKECNKVTYLTKAAKEQQTGAGCILNGLEFEDVEQIDFAEKVFNSTKMINLETRLADGEGALEENEPPVATSPISEAKGWDIELPEGTLEFTIVMYGGLIRRLALMKPNAEGKYTTVELYKNKHEIEAMGVATLEKCAYNVYDEYTSEGNTVANVRSFYLAELAEDGSKATLLIGNAKKTEENVLFYPHGLYQQVVDACGYIPSMYAVPKDAFLQEKGMLASWDDYCDWQAKALNTLIKDNSYNVVFSHLHNIDAMGHQSWIFAKERTRDPYPNADEKDFQRILHLTYEQTDRYIGKFLHLLDEGWTIFLVSDHGLIVGEDDENSFMGDPFGVNARVMVELGYHALVIGEDGKYKKETDWSKTTAVAQRGNYIYINLKGRTPFGIVDPEDKYELEEKIMNDLYNYRDENGDRIIYFAMRNKDAAILGLGGDRCGDIVYWCEEHKGRVHGDTVSCAEGYYETSVSPIFVAAGTGIKKGFITERAIRTIDLVPTMAMLTGVRMPAQCEGAPVYQIFEDEF